MIAAVTSIGVSCKRPILEVNPEETSLSSIRIGEPDVASDDYYDTATIALECID